ncbi:MAG TPA: efflux RND transporter periplasmic adaptor subunit [Verrucomicrobiae bacterium]|nr:efflux RND transporter periplasmic adaptor subunit [Verrucomicrobiae bacterium]
MNLQRIACFGAVIVAALCLTGCNKARADKKDDKKETKDDALPVEVTTLTRGGIEATIRNSTHLEAEEEVKVYARTANRVTELLVEEGDVVKKDQILLRLDKDIQTTAYTKAEASVAKGREEFEREKALFEQKLVSEQSFNNSKHELRQLELAVEDAKRGLEYTEVRAPIAGTISQRLVKYGDLVNLNQHLFDIVDFNSMVARIYVPEKHLPDIKLDQPARVTATPFAGTEFKGYVKRIAPIVEARTGTVKVTIGLREIGQLRPGMYVDVELITAKRADALLITKRALLYDGELSYVFRLMPERKVERVVVESKIADKLNIEPLSGFNEGDQIVVAGQTGLKDGAKVRLPGDKPPDEKKEAKEENAQQPAPAKKS